MSAEGVTVFEFGSGSPHHPEGFGAWTVRWDDTGFSITHRVRDDVIEYPPVSLAGDDEAELRKLIDAAALERREDSHTPGTPDRVPASFRIARGEHVTTVKVWVDWDRPDDPVVQLIQKIAALIEKHTGVTPVLAS